MRCESAASLKSKKRHDWLQKIPRQGSTVRRVYDRLMASKGEFIDLFDVLPNPRSKAIYQLQDFYGLDIRSQRVPGDRAGRCGKGLYHKKYAVVGEWFGRVYVDYIVERMVNIDKGSDTAE